jgi:hypothetical protein
VIPTKFFDWERREDDARFDAAGVEALGTELYLSRIYSNINRSVPTLHLHIAYYTGQVDAVPHVPDRCMVAGGFVPLTPEPKTLPLNIDTTTWADDNSEELDGVPYPVVTDWNKLTEQEEIIRMPLGDFEIRITEFSHPQIGDDHFFAGYFFIANGKTTAYPERIRLLAFDRSSQFAYYCKLQFTLRGNRDFTVEKFVDIVSEFSKDLLPEVMRCLPDWAEVTSPLNETRALEN